MAALPLDVALCATVVSAGGLLLLRWPWLVWPGIGAALPWLSAVTVVGPVSVTDLALAGAAALWLIDGARRRTLRVDGSPVLALLLLFVAAQLVSLLRAPDLAEATAEVVKWIEFGSALMLAAAMLTPRQARWLVVGLLIGGGSQAILGLYQFVNRIGPEWFIILGRFMRASGTFRQPNPFAGYLGLLLPVAVSLALWSWAQLWRGGWDSCTGRGRTHPVVQWRDRGLRVAPPFFYSVIAGLIAAGLLASWSRGGWLGALAGVATVIVLRSRIAALLSGIALLLALVAALLGAFRPDFIPAPVMARVQDIPAYLGLTDVLAQPLTDENFAVAERVAHWVAALRMWELAPWFGVGPGNYATLYPLVRLPLWEEALGHAHNIYLNVLAESGLVGLTAFFALWIGVAVWLWRTFRSAPRGSYGGAVAVGVLGSIVHLSVHNGFDNLFVQGIYIEVALLLAAVHVGKVDSEDLW